VLKIPRDMFTSHCLLPRGRTAAVVRGDHGVGALFAPGSADRRGWDG